MWRLYVPGVSVVSSVVVVDVKVAAFHYHHLNRHNSSNDTVKIKKYSAKRENLRILN